MRTYTTPSARLIPEFAKCVFKGKIFDTYQWEQELFDGSTATFEMLKRPDTVQILAITEDRILVHEEQQPNTDIFYTFPGGRHEVESETELEAAKRELLEESGYEFKHWKLVAVEQPHTKIEWFIYTFVANEIANKQEPSLDAGERIKTNELNLAELRKLITREPLKAKYLNLDIFDKIKNLAQLIELPDLHE